MTHDTNSTTNSYRPGEHVTTPDGDGRVSPGRLAGSDSILVDLADGTLRMYGPELVSPRGPLAVCGNGCELPGDEFTRLGGNHVCSEHADSFRSGYCPECSDTIESEGLCGHGSYPDSCGYADSVFVVEWMHVGDSEWIREGEPVQESEPVRICRGEVCELVAAIFADCVGESGGPYAVDLEDILPDGFGSVVYLPPMPHADGQTFVRARVRRGSL